jgi:hypothetical protein
MRSYHTLDNDFSGPEPLMQPLEATLCRGAILANAGHIGLPPELIAFHKRDAERLRQAAFRRAGRTLRSAVVQFIRRAH